MQVAALRARDAALQQALAERNIDNVELRRQLAAARQAADPHIAQARPPAAANAPRLLDYLALAAARGRQRYFQLVAEPLVTS